MDLKNVIDTINELVKNKFCDDSSGHDWYHIDRVRNNALRLQQSEGGDKEVIELAALLHDISDYKFNGGDALEGGKVAFQIILDKTNNLELAKQIQEIVDSISYKGAQVADTTTSLEAKIVQDADRLDAIGAIGIARTFAYGGFAGNAMYDPNVPHQLHQSFEAYKHSKSTTINHFHEKLLLLEARMHTESARKIARDRTQYMEDFVARFLGEWNNTI